MSYVWNGDTFSHEQNKIYMYSHFMRKVYVASTEPQEMISDTDHKPLLARRRITPPALHRMNEVYPENDIKRNESTEGQQQW